MTLLRLSQPRGDLRRNGPKLRVHIGHPLLEIEAAKKAGRTLHSGLDIVGIIDTGSSVTVANPQVVRTCQLKQTGTKKICAPGQLSERPVYAASITFQNTELRPLTLISIVGCPLPEQEGVSCLIGRDILENWVFTYDGTSGEIRIEEP